MNKQIILKEAQQIASQFSFWMVSGNIDHIFGYVLETKNNNYGLEIKFGTKFPQEPPKIEFHEEIKDLFGNIELKSVKNWTSHSSAIEIVKELAFKIKEKLGMSSDGLEPQTNRKLNTSNSKEEDQIEFLGHKNNKQESTESVSDQDYITPDLNAYPPDFQREETYIQSYSEQDLFIDESEESIEINNEKTSPDIQINSSESSIFESKQSVDFMTELGLVRQEYAYDEIGTKTGQIQVYITITLTKTFIIKLDFSNYPDKPNVTVPSEVRKIIGDPYQNLESLKGWSPKNAPHIVEILRELEKKLFSLKEIEKELQKIKREYQFQQDPNNLTKLRIHLLTYGFEEYLMDLDLEPYPKPPKISLSSRLKELISNPTEELTSIKNWKSNESEVVDIIREISWLVDKNSRINFELELLREEYKEIDYNPENETLTLEMNGKMKTEDLQFQFEINLPRSYPMKVPDIKIINKFELESHEKVKQDLESSFKGFFDEWTPYSYLVDLFHLISKKIFEVSAVSCVICHKIECPTCSLKIAAKDEEKCFIECPFCDRAYHKHCWDQTIKSFGKCGFCLKTPPANYIP